MEKNEETALYVRRKAAVVFGENHILEETEDLRFPPRVLKRLKRNSH
jgi:hypothetical protein